MYSTSNKIWETPAGVPPRIVARFLDALVLCIIDGTIGELIGFGFGWLVMSAAIVFLYFVLMDMFFGATVGKFALGLRVTGPFGGRPTLHQSLIRESFTVLGAIPYLGPPFALAAWAWIIWTARSNSLRQGKHDLLAGGTRVLRLTANP